MANTQVKVIAKITEQSRRALRNLEEQNISALQEAYKKAQVEIAGRISALIGKGPWNTDDVKAMRFDTALNDSINQIIADLGNKTNSIIEDGMTEQYKESHAWSAYTLDQSTPGNIHPNANILPEANIRALVNEPFQGAMFSDRIGLITDGMAQDIKDGLLQSLINGESMADAAVRVDDIIGDTSTWANRAEMIARTEIMRAQNLGRDYVYDQNSDVVEGTEWISTSDGRLCEWCERRDGMSDEEIRNTESGDDPFGNSTEQPSHPNCRCTKAPKMKSWSDLGIDMPEEWDDTTRGYRDEETGKWKIEPLQDFSAWRQQNQ